MSGMLQIEGNSLSSGKSMLVVLCLAIGTVVGELIGIERGFDRFGEWLKVKTGNGGDAGFVNAFVTASLTVSIGAMAIVGSIQDGLLNDYSTLAVKAVIDFIIIAVMTSAMGRGCIFSVIPVFVFEGGMTLLARLVAPIMTETAIIVPVACRFAADILRRREPCVGQEGERGEHAAVVLLAVLAAYLPWSF